MNISRSTKSILVVLGTRRVRDLVRYIRYMTEYRNFKKCMQNTVNRFEMKFTDQWPCLNDRTTTTSFDRHYVFHTAWAARCLKKINPERHVDISSSLFFCSIVSTFIPIDFYDYRPAELNLSQLQSRHADILQLPFADESVSSLSCMHVVEHIGLGRYGDPFDPDGDLKAIAELRRVIANKGSLLFVVPLGSSPKIMFNAHRVYNYDQVISYFESFELMEFALISEDKKGGSLLYNASKEELAGQEYACGCFWFKKSAELEKQ